MSIFANRSQHIGLIITILLITLIYVPYQNLNSRAQGAVDCNANPSDPSCSPAAAVPTPPPTTPPAVDCNANPSDPSCPPVPFPGKDFGDFSDLAKIPLIGGAIASHSIATGVLHNEQGVFIPWNVICQKGSQYLLESCATLLNPDGSLTSKGDTAIGCIRNGFAAAILGTKLGLSFDAIKSALDFAAGATGCGGIVDLKQIQNSPDFQSLLAAVPVQ